MTIVLENSVDGLYVKWLVNDTIVREYTSSSIVLENFTEATIGLYDNSISNGSLLVDHMRIDIDNTTVFNIDYSYWIGGQHGYIIDSCGGPSINYVVETTPPISEPIEVVIIVVSLIVMTLIAIVKAGSRSFSR